MGGTLVVFSPCFSSGLLMLLQLNCLLLYFRIILKAGSFPLCWRSANTTPVPKGPLSPLVENSIFINYVLSKVYERQVSARLGRFFESSCVLSSQQWLDQIGLSGALDHVNCSGVHYKLCSVGVDGSLFSLMDNFYRTKSFALWLMVGKEKSVMMDGISCVSQGIVLGPFLFLYWTTYICFWFINSAGGLRGWLHNNRRLSLWQPSMTKTLVVSSSRTVAPRCNALAKILSSVLIWKFSVQHLMQNRRSSVSLEWLRRLHLTESESRGVFGNYLVIRLFFNDVSSAICCLWWSIAHESGILLSHICGFLIALFQVLLFIGWCLYLWFESSWQALCLLSPVKDLFPWWSAAGITSQLS